MMYITISWATGYGKPESRGTCAARCAPCTETSDNIKGWTHHSVTALNLQSKCMLLNSAQCSTPFATDWTVRGSNSCWGEIFRTCPHRPWGPRGLLYNGPGSFAGGKVAGAWLLSPTPSRAEVKVRVELYLSSPSRPSWPVVGWTLHLLLRWNIGDGHNWELCVQ